MKRGHSNVRAEQTVEWKTVDQQVSPGHARIPLVGGSTVQTVKELPPLALDESEWRLIGQKMGWSHVVGTVNVIDCKKAEDFAVEGLKSFPDTPEGNKAAEALFVEWVKQSADPANLPSEEDLEAALEDGIFEIGEGFIAITHST